MSTKTPKRPRDANQLAKMVVDIASGLSPRETDSPSSEMAALGRSGGLKGGRARANKLSPEQRSEIAQRAAAARWRKNDG